MEVMYLLIAFSLLLASGFLLAFMWAVRSGQYDDRYTPSVRMLIDDIRPGEKKDLAGRGAGGKQTGSTRISDDGGSRSRPDGTATGPLVKQSMAQKNVN